MIKSMETLVQNIKQPSKIEGKLDSKQGSKPAIKQSMRVGTKQILNNPIKDYSKKSEALKKVVSQAHNVKDVPKNSTKNVHNRTLSQYSAVQTVKNHDIVTKLIDKKLMVINNYMSARSTVSQSYNQSTLQRTENMKDEHMKIIKQKEEKATQSVIQGINLLNNNEGSEAVASLINTRRNETNKGLVFNKNNKKASSLATASCKIGPTVNIQKDLGLEKKKKLSNQTKTDIPAGYFSTLGQREKSLNSRKELRKSIQNHTRVPSCSTKVHHERNASENSAFKPKNSTFFKINKAFI